MNRQTYRIDIDRLVLDGLDLNQGQAEHFRVLLERELSGHLSAGELPKGPSSILRMQAPDLDLHFNLGPTKATPAASVAQAVAEALRSARRG